MGYEFPDDKERDEMTNYDIAELDLLIGEVVLPFKERFTPKQAIADLRQFVIAKIDEANYVPKTIDDVRPGDWVTVRESLRPALVTEKQKDQFWVHGIGWCNFPECTPCPPPARKDR